MTATQQLLTAQEMADILRISSRHLWDLEREGKIPSVRLGKAVRYDAMEVLNELKDGIRRE